MNPLVAFLPRHRGLGLLCAATAIAAVWRAWPAPELDPPRRAVSWALVPLSGDVVANAVDDADGEPADDGWDAPNPPVEDGCVPFLRTLVAHDHWQLQIDERRSGCMGTEQLRTFVVDDTGEVVVHERGLRDRRLELTADELDQLRRADQLSCVRTEPIGYGERFYALSIGPGDGQGGAHIAAESPLGTAVGVMLDAARARYADQVAATRPVRVDARARSEEQSATWTRRTAIYRLEVDAGGLLTVHRGRRLLYRAQLEAQDLADLVDATPDPDADVIDRDGGDYALARGTLMIDRWRHPLTVSFFERSPGRERLFRALDEADYAARHPDEPLPIE